MSLAVGTKGVDSASRIDPVAAHKSGSAFQVRYSAGAATDPSHPSHAKNNGKLLQDGELQAILNSGQDFLANDEWSEDRVTEGAHAAEEDAPVTLRFWRQRGLAKGSSIALNLDTGFSQANLPAIEAYFDRTKAIWGGEYVPDRFYGPLECARQLARSGRIKHFWIPEGASYFTPDTPIAGAPAPANSAWDLWAPTPTQVPFAIRWLMDQIGDDAKYFDSIIWQDLNKWFNGQADENIVLKGVRLGSHRDHAALPSSPKLSALKLYQGHDVPSLIARGSGQYLGSISGPKESHGGDNDSERLIVKMLQQRLIVCGFVPGHTNPNDGWADGIYDTRADKPDTGATSQAVARFQRAHMPNTQAFGQCWWDDWTKLFNL